MIKHRHHSEKEIEAKLMQAEEMAAQGNTQNEISKALGISVMTYHRWRRSHAKHSPNKSSQGILVEEVMSAPAVSASHRQSAAEKENERLRRLVIDLLLEKVALDDLLKGKKAKFS